jgi:hypothetical protein
MRPEQMDTFDDVCLAGLVMRGNRVNCEMHNLDGLRAGELQTGGGVGGKDPVASVKTAVVV